MDKLAAFAYRQVRRALESGELSKPSACQWCGALGLVVAYHADYARPLAVEWLCRSCDGKHHIKSTRPGLSRQGIWYRKHKAGKRPLGRPRGSKIREMAEKLGISYQAMWMRLRRPYGRKRGRPPKAKKNGKSKTS